ncbi:sensor histidine kinase [Hymenobacter negativus]|uniref:histidine kinase n=1 Tax=Hymenobacter negativus TaxID=2795026 RepID=A0ABS3QJZ3_9BACT|nr:ATP-binding protein [Hymenobacter negativus]MBO2011578.1 cyclic nucleotide-binding domain-containing protein [Hymenobacter negativus]
MPHLLPLDVTALNNITAFQNLPAEILTWLSQAGELHQYMPGEVIAEAGSRADSLMAVVAGEMHYYSQIDGRPAHVFRIEQGQVGGVLPYSRFEVYQGQVVAVGETVVYLLSRHQFAALEQVSPELVQRLVSLMNDRSRDYVRSQERDDKLRALGKLSAGLSHELNNPAAAISRASAALASALQATPLLLQGLLIACPSEEAVAALTALSVLPAEAPLALSALEAADREEELADWLETQGSPDGYALANSLLEAGLTVPTLILVAALLPAAARPDAFNWLSSYLTALRLASDISEASRRISTLVGDVKTYSHMDRATGHEKLDITTGLESTLHMFDYALRQKNVRLTRRYAPDLPLVMGQAGSLNQVWTNLIDNALDALPDQGGELVLSATRQQQLLRIGIQDNGSGITPEVLAHIFEPFYTTKPPGQGSGQGLDIACRIIREHGGRLEAMSVPGRTEFVAWLPVA